MSGNRQCARPGCGGAVAALLSYDYAGQRIWLDDPGAEPGGHHSALCAAHASRLRAPKGWSCQDRRTYRAPQNMLVPGRVVYSTPVPPAESRSSGPVAVGSPLPGPLATDSPPGAAVTAGSTDDTLPLADGTAWDATASDGPASGGPGAESQGMASPIEGSGISVPAPAVSPAPGGTRDQAPAGAVPPQRDGGVIAGLTAIAV